MLAALNKMAMSPDVKVSGNSRMSNRVSVGSVNPLYTNDTAVCIQTTEGQHALHHTIATCMQGTAKQTPKLIGIIIVVLLSQMIDLPIHFVIIY